MNPSFNIGLDVPLEVSAALELINGIFSEALPLIVVEGEVAEFKVNQGKFVFFNIKDEEATLGCFMMAFSLATPLEDGMRVRLIAQPKLTKWGKFSLTVREVAPVGEGSLKRSKELLRTKLQTEGLFDESRKRELPRLPQRIAVVSSVQAAGYQDFLKILDSRWGGMDVVVANVAVQGLEAPRQIEKAIKYLNELADPCEIIVILRGGGSADDLSGFDSEVVVRAIAASRIPTLVGVGHEKDISLADLAADVRASTPSNAAEIIVPDRREILEKAQRTMKIAENGVNTAIKVFEMDGKELLENIESENRRQLDEKEELLGRLRQTLRQLDPQQVLRRGYALVRGEGGYIRKTTDVTIGESISIEVSDGIIKTEVV